MKKIKTIDINALEWFDRINGNSYFAGRVIINYGMPDQVSVIMPFQYGYGEQYQHEAAKQLDKAGLLPNYTENTAIWRYCEENDIIIRYNKENNCKKRELMMFTKLIDSQA